MSRLLTWVLLVGVACTAPVPGSGGRSRDAAQGPCDDGALKCLGTSMVMTCVAGSWQEGGQCEAGLSCYRGTCRDDACHAGTQRCDLGRRQVCDADGSTWRPDPCAESEVCSGDGLCGSANCDPGAYRCADVEDQRWPQRQRCADDSSEWQNAECRRGEVCVEDGNCQRMECLPDSTGCVDDRTVGRCNADGTAMEATETCPDGTACSAGSCIDLCNQARARQSYDGCVFFAVDLPQIKESDIYTDPFAVSLANPHDFPVTVRITAAGGQAVLAGSGVRVPGATGINRITGARTGFTTVNSYVEDADGSRNNVAGAIEAVAIPAGGMGVFILPENTAGLAVRGNQVTYRSELENRAYRVEASAPVTAYQFSPICCNHSYSNDASILFPAGSQGRKYIAVSLPYLNMMQGRPAESPSFISIVASDEAADVEINIGNRLIQPVAGAAVTNGQMNVRLQPYQVLTILSANGNAARTDLTGVQITASAEVALFGGHICTELPHGNAACDHVETSLMPLETWRNEYVGSHTHHRSSSRNEVNYYRIVASNEGASLRFDPALSGLATHGAIAAGLPDCRALAAGEVVELAPGSWCEFGTRRDFVLRSDRPVQMVQFVTSQATTGLNGVGRHAGDPAMSAVAPSEQYRSQYTFLTPDTYFANYINVVHPPGALLELDGQAINPVSMGNSARTPFIQVDNQPIGDGSWALTILGVGSGQHSIESMTLERFGITAYAYDDYVSYAFPGGLDLEKR